MRHNAPLIIVLALLIVGGFAVILLSGIGADRRVDNSVIGLNGLAIWFQDDGIPVRRSAAGFAPEVGDLSLRIMPLYDMDLRLDAPDPSNADELERQQTQRDINVIIYGEKVSRMLTLVLLPKWTTGMIEDGIAHRSRLIPTADFNRLFEQLSLSGLRLQRDNAVFVTHAVGGSGRRQPALFHAQTFVPESVPDNCRPIVSFGSGVLVIACQSNAFDHETYFVSDPDLMNNHGLSVGENAAFVSALVKQLVSGDPDPVYVDTRVAISTTVAADQDERQDYQRSGDDLARFFAYPLSALWAVMLFVLAVLFWRGSVRFGPLEREAGTSPDQSKTAAIATKARLLRLSDSDGYMVADFVRHQLMDLTTALLGPDAGEAGIKRYFAQLSRRDAKLGSAFQSACDRLINNAENTPRTELFQLLETYKTLLDKVEKAHGSIGISKTR
ncbi:MAG: hypothetical protein AAF724_21610 [Pseudomonadota bacterium]